MNPNPFQSNVQPTIPPAPTPDPDAIATASAPQTSIPPAPAPNSQSIPLEPIAPAFIPAPPPSSPQPAPTAASPAASGKNHTDNRPTQYEPTTKSNFTCPFCLEDIHTSELLYYCKECNDTYTTDEAKAAKKYRLVKRQYFCHGTNITGSRMCPNCEILATQNNSLHLTRLVPAELIERSNEFRLCMTGYSASGKTQYLTQLLDHISKSPTPGVSNTRFIDRQTRATRDAIRNKIFVEGKLTATPQGYLDPLLYDIDSRGKSNKSVFYDISGENFTKNPDTLQDHVVQKCIWSSNNIILIIDPTTLPGVQQHPNVVELKQRSGQFAGGDTVDSLQDYINFIRENHPGKAGDKFLKKVNLAVVFTKMDLFYDDDDDDFHPILKSESSHMTKKIFDIQEVEFVNREMKSWIESQGGELLVNALASYPSAKIFGVSSGSHDIARDRGGRPRRLLDPYLWLLYQNGILN